MGGWCGGSPVGKETAKTREIRGFAGWRYVGKGWAGEREFAAQIRTTVPVRTYRLLLYHLPPTILRDRSK